MAVKGAGEDEAGEGLNELVAGVALSEAGGARNDGVCRFGGRGAVEAGLDREVETDGDAGLFGAVPEGLPGCVVNGRVGAGGEDVEVLNAELGQAYAARRGRPAGLPWRAEQRR